jgi:methylated-DNA-[protein]-cysteine S-methyltransferase
MEKLKYKIISSPVGELKIVVENDALAAILWDNEKPKRVSLAPTIESKSDPFLLEVEKQLNAYFQAGLTTFNLPLNTQEIPFPL